MNREREIERCLFIFHVYVVDEFRQHHAARLDIL